jgi:hypothetical protein
MRTVYLLLFFLLIVNPLFSQELREMRLLGEPVKLDSEMVARRDINGNYCAAIQVISDMDGFAYDAFDGVMGDVDSRPGLDIVFLTTNERVLEIYKTGYQPLRVILSEVGIRLRPREVWQITVAGDAPAAQTLPVTIRITPADAALSINGSPAENSGTQQLAPGSHTLKIEKAGFQTIEQNITVNEQQVFFEFTLQRQPDAGLQIETTPAGAAVYLDGVLLGQSPVAVFYKPGNYSIRIVKDGYVTIENQTLEVALPKTVKSYTLEENVGWLTINTHSGATVYFNGEVVSNPNSVKLPPQLVRVKVTMSKAEPLEQQVVLKRNDRTVLQMYPDVQTSTLQVAVTPFDAKIELTGDAGEKYTATGMKVFEDIPVGSYTIKVSAAGHETAQETITLRQGERESRSVRLSEIKTHIEKQSKATKITENDYSKKKRKPNLRYGLQVGWGGATMVHYDDSVSYTELYDYEAISGFFGGAMINLPIFKYLSIESGLNYQRKGYQAKSFDSLYLHMFPTKLSLNYLMVPLLIKFDNLPRVPFIFDGIFFGSDLGIAISGKQRIGTSYDYYERNVKFGRGTDQYTRFDHGFIAGLSMKVESIIVNAYFSFGRSSISNLKRFGHNLHNESGAISISYLF